MDTFIRLIPEAAKSPYALVAYTIAAVLFVFGGMQQFRLRTLVKALAIIPKNQQSDALTRMIGEPLPPKMTPAQWLRHQRMRYVFLITAGLVIAIFTVVILAVLALNDSAKSDGVTSEVKIAIDEQGRLITQASKEQRILIERQSELLQEEGDKHRQLIQETGAKQSKEIIEALGQKVDKGTLINLETMFPLAIRMERFADDGVQHLSGEAEIPLISFYGGPLKVHGGDTIKYTVFRTTAETLPENAYVTLYIPSSNRRVDLRVGGAGFVEDQVIIPGVPPKPILLRLLNPLRLHVDIKMSVLTTGAETAREKFRQAVLAFPEDSEARKGYRMILKDMVKLRRSPSPTASVFRAMAQGTYVKVLGADGDWTHVNLPEGHTGWVLSELLGPLR